MVNHYTLETNLLTVSDDGTQQNTAYERLKCWMYRIANDSILIHDQDPQLVAFAATGSRLLTLPDEPVDQNLGIMLYLKLNAIMENRMVITDVEIWSTQGDEASYLHSVGENIGNYFSQDGWWVDAKPTWTTVKGREQGKVVSLDRPPEWTDFNLGWEYDDARNATVITAFPKDENK